MRKAMSVIMPAALLGAAMLVSGCSTLSRGPVGNTAVPQPAKAVDITRYQGLWYEIARYENGFEKGCEAVTAQYGPLPDGKIEVINTCHKGAVDGPVSSAKGKAKVVDGSQNAKLKVSFFGPFYGDYWVLDRAEDYSWAIVGEPSGRYLWILSRTANLSEADRNTLFTRAGELGYNTALIRPVKH